MISRGFHFVARPLGAASKREALAAGLEVQGSPAIAQLMRALVKAQGEP